MLTTMMGPHHDAWFAHLAPEGPSFGWVPARTPPPLQWRPGEHHSGRRLPQGLGGARHRNPIGINQPILGDKLVKGILT